MLGNNGVLNVIKEYGVLSNLHGVPCLIRSKTLYQKLLWLLFLVTSIIFSIFLTLENIQSYLEYDVVTSVETIYEQPTEFPAITMCTYKNHTFSRKTLNEFLLNCSFSYELDCQDDPYNFFEVFNNSYYGHCIRFNSGKNYNNQSISILNSTIGGLDDSLTIELDEHQDMVVWVHNKSLPPNLEFKNNHNKGRIFVPANAYTDIAIQKIIENKLGLPYNDCLENANKFKNNKTIIDFIHSTGQTYSQQKCLELCFDLDYIETNPCNCTNVRLDNVWQTCWYQLENQSFDSCTWKQKASFYSKSLVETCSKYCPLECNSVSYDIHSSSLPYRKKTKTTKIKIYFGSLNYILISQKPKIDEYDLISLVGGVLSLFIGFCFATFFELFEIFVEILLSFNYKIKNNQMFKFN